MAFNINRVTIVGTLGADAESRSFQNGGGVVNFRVATTDSWKDTDAKQERTEWHSVAVFAKWLQDDCKQLRKGDKVSVEGKLQTRKWQDNSGNDRYTTEIVVQGMEHSVFPLAKRQRSDSGGQGGGNDFGGGSGSYGGGGTTSRPQPAAFDSDLDDDVPF
jgi:single-strand DNA-binding protein